MAATQDQMRRSITPGSLPFGQRQAFTQSLQQVGATPQGPVGGAPAQGPAQNLGIPGNPLDFLAGGRVRPDSDELTAGLSVGPGPGPGGAEVPDSRMERMRLLALHAQSPVLRELARRGLNTMARERRLGN